MNTTRLALVAMATALSSAASWPAKAVQIAFYQFTPIVDTNDGIFSNLSGFPAINNDGDVAFRAMFTGGVSGIFSRSSTGVFKVIADDGIGEFWLFNNAPMIDGSGSALFIGDPGPPGSGVTGIYRGSGGHPTAVVDNTGPFDYFQALDVNEAAQVAFAGDGDDGRRSIAMHSGSTTTSIATEGPTTFSWLGSNAAINSSGAVAFSGTRVNGRRGVFRRTGSGPIYTLIDDTGPLDAFGGWVDMNDAGTAVTMASLDTGPIGLFVIENGAPTAVAYEGGILSWVGPFSINAAGTVAWAGNFGGGVFSQAIFDGSHLVANRVIGTGDVLFGRTVANALVGHDAINDAGGIVMSLSFYDGSHMLVVATPYAIFDWDSIRLDQDLQFTTGDGSGVSAGQTVPNPGGTSDLAFDVRFLSEGGTLDVRVDGVIVHSMRAVATEKPVHVVVPVDVSRIYGGRAPPASIALELVLNGSSGVTARLDDITFPRLANGDFEGEWLDGWRVDTRSGGSAVLVYGGEVPSASR